MGLALHNAQAVWEGLTGKPSPFIRTPKYNLGKSQKSWTKNIYNQIKIPFTTYIEGLFALIFLVMVVMSFYFKTYEMLVFHLMLTFGYSVVFIESLKSYRLK